MTLVARRESIYRINANLQLASRIAKERAQLLCHSDAVPEDRGPSSKSVARNTENTEGH